ANPAAQPGGNGEGQQEIGTGQETVGLGLEPGLGLILLAARAMPVATRTSDGMGVTARRALVEHHPQLAGATGHDRVEDFLMLHGHRRAKPLEVFRPVLPQHVGYRRHRTTPTSAWRWWPAPVPDPGKLDGDRPSSPGGNCVPGTSG